MSLRYDNRTVTDDGNDLLAYSLSQKKSVVVDATIVSQQTVQTGTELEELTINDFGNYIQFPANNIKYKKNTFVPGATITNHNILSTNKSSQYLSNISVPKDNNGNPIKDSNGNPVTYQLGDLTSDFMINMVGMIAHTEGENNQVLLNVAIANPNKAWKIPEYSEDIPYNNNFDFPIAYSHAANVIIDVSNAGYVTQEDLRDAMKHAVSIDEDGNVVRATNFTNSLKYKGSEVATKLDTGDAYNQAVNDTENYVKNNSIIVDNTISGLFSYGGNRLISLGGTPSTHDFNTMTTTGFFVSNDTVNHYANGPTYLQDGNRQFSLIVTDTGTDIYQQLMMAGNPPMYRMLQWGVWTNWQRLLFMERIPVPATITGDAYGTANAISAFYDVSQQNIYLNGFIDVNMPNFCTLNLDVSNIRAYISMPNINVVGSSFNGLDGGINTPTKGLVDNTNKIAISFKNKQRYSLEASVINLNIQ